MFKLPNRCKTGKSNRNKPMSQQQYNKFYEVSSLTIKIGVAMLFLLIIAGTVGYRLIEGWEWIDCLYMTIITMATVGFKEVGPLSLGGKIFTMVLIVTSLGILAYVTTSLARFVFDGELANYIKSRI